MRTPYGKLQKFEKSQINGLTKLLGSTRFGMGRQDDRLTPLLDECRLSAMYHTYEHDATVMHFDRPRKITAEQTALGKSWLKDYFFKKDGSTRSGKRTESVSESVLSICRSVSRFEFIGVVGLPNGMNELVQFLPIYRTYDRHGNYFDYAPIHWGSPIIIEEYFRAEDRRERN